MDDTEDEREEEEEATDVRWLAELALSEADYNPEERGESEVIALINIAFDKYGLPELPPDQLVIAGKLSDVHSFEGGMELLDDFLLEHMDEIKEDRLKAHLKTLVQPG